MKKILLLLLLGLPNLTIYSELLIIKKEGNCFVPLEQKDYSSKVSEILLKYQWPMVIATRFSKDELTEEEQEKLFASGKPRAEEEFIQKKIREELGSNKYYVVFIPTSVYEELALAYEKFLQKFSDKFWPKDSENPLVEVFTLEFLNPADKKERTYSAMLAKIYNVYNNNNKVFFDGASIDKNASFYINDKLTKKLFAWSPEFKDTGILSENLLKKIAENDFGTWTNYEDLPDHYFLGHELEKEKRLRTEIIKVEYKARELNNALLFRGSNPIMVKEVPNKKRNDVMLIGSTLHNPPLPRRGLFQYSVSFGNSVYAGSVRDLGGRAKTPMQEEIAYVLFIDKKDYYQHRCNRLFFISPLATLSALFQKGETFHSRTTISRGTGFVGMADYRVYDPVGVLQIERDPFKHAEMFSKFLADNAQILKFGSNIKSRMTEEDIKLIESAEKNTKIFAEKVKESQYEQAEFYKRARLLRGLIKKRKREEIEEPRRKMHFEELDEKFKMQKL